MLPHQRYFRAIRLLSILSSVSQREQRICFVEECLESGSTAVSFLRFILLLGLGLEKVGLPDLFRW